MLEKNILSKNNYELIIIKHQANAFFGSNISIPMSPYYEVEEIKKISSRYFAQFFPPIVS